MSELIAKGIVKKYGKKEVLHGVDLKLESGKIYGLIGRNGAGKTTLLSILTSQNPATSGEVTFDGQPVWENPEVLRHLCFSRELSPLTGSNANSMKVKEYLRIAATFFPYWDKEMEKRLVEEFELDVKKKISKLSKGMLSMVTIVVALASKAEFTFLDEPVAGLDVVARERFYELLLEEFTETGRTFVVSTHIIEEAAEVLEEVIIVDHGKILLKENTQDLLDRSFHISGHEDEVDRAIEGMEVHHEEHLGRSKGVTVLLKPGQKITEGYDVSIQKLSLQKVFVALCGEETRHE
ncbi:MAG: ABC transporter ATP-binding protein [Lachnospiraceae bacterium]|nr:ABC transporter ATP-binding protein [Lachnospiraceae bacterium]MDD7078878.1 ABC transporter ATP-binding protein [Lachnospiraceae bacterium]MDY3730137.1 ABC transporter ATP-binding protein [Candidatus Choladocola sp.]